jgi:hypothetical protein
MRRCTCRSCRRCRRRTERRSSNRRRWCSRSAPPPPHRESPAIRPSPGSPPGRPRRPRSCPSCRRSRRRNPDGHPRGTRPNSCTTRCPCTTARPGTPCAMHSSLRPRSTTPAPGPRSRAPAATGRPTPPMSAGPRSMTAPPPRRPGRRPPRTPPTAPRRILDDLADPSASCPCPCRVLSVFQTTPDPTWKPPSSTCQTASGVPKQESALISIQPDPNWTSARRWTMPPTGGDAVKTSWYRGITAYIPKRDRRSGDQSPRPPRRNGPAQAYAPRHSTMKKVSG